MLYIQNLITSALNTAGQTELIHCIQVQKYLKKSLKCGGCLLDQH